MLLLWILVENAHTRALHAWEKWHFYSEKEWKKMIASKSVIHCIWICTAYDKNGLCISIFHTHIFPFSEYYSIQPSRSRLENESHARTTSSDASDALLCACEMLYFTLFCHSTQPLKTLIDSLSCCCYSCWCCATATDVECIFVSFVSFLSFLPPLTLQHSFCSIPFWIKYHPNQIIYHRLVAVDTLHCLFVFVCYV